MTPGEYYLISLPERAAFTGPFGKKYTAVWGPVSMFFEPQSKKPFMPKSKQWFVVVGRGEREVTLSAGIIRESVAVKCTNEPIHNSIWKT